MEEAVAPRPVLAPIGFTAGLLAFGGILTLLFVSGDPLTALMGGLEGPWAQAIMATAVVGLLASIVAFARREPSRLITLGALMSAAALLAKFFLIAFLVLIVLGFISAALSG